MKNLLVIFFAVFALSLEARVSKPVWQGIGWSVLPTAHYNIHYPTGQDELARAAALYAEQAYYHLSNRMDHNIAHVVSIFVYPSAERFQDTNILGTSPGEGTGGFTDQMRRRVVLPFTGDYAEFRHVLIHEIVHTFQYDILLGTSGEFSFPFGGSMAPPLWLIEGSAEYFSAGYDIAADSFVREAMLSGTMPTLREMSSGRVSNGFVFYKGGQAAVKFIADTFGERFVTELIRSFGRNNNPEAAIRSVFGISLEELDEQFMVYLKKRTLPHVSATLPEESFLLTHHDTDNSWFNHHAAISPDGKYIAYLSIRKFYPVVVLRELSDDLQKKEYNYEKVKKKKTKETIVARSYIASHSYSLNLMDNRLSFSPDGKWLLFSTQTTGADELVLYSIADKKIKKRFRPSVEAITDPTFGKDGNTIVFAGLKKSQQDIYSLSMETGELKQITDTIDSERYPCLSPDGTTILYVSGNDGTYILVEKVLETGETRELFSSGKISEPCYASSDSMYFISDFKGAANAYAYTIGTGTIAPLTTFAAGIQTLSHNGKTIAATLQRNQGYDIALFPAAVTNDQQPIVVDTVSWDLPPLNPETFAAKPYFPMPYFEYILMGAQYSNYSGFGSYGQSALSDYSGNHRMTIFTYIISAAEIYNFHLDYGYLRHRTNFYGGMYQKNNAFGLFTISSLQSINDILYYPAFISSSNEIMGYATAEYPITHHWSVSGSLAVGRLDEEYYYERRPPIHAHLQIAKAAIVHNNVLYSAWGPLDGWHLGAVTEQTFPLTGDDAVYHRSSLDMRTYFTWGVRYTLALRGFYGAVLGPQQNSFPFELGGYNTLRGFPYMAVQGTQAFLMSAEFRYPFLDALLFGFPAPWLMPGFSLVNFVDAGGATFEWDTFSGYNKSEKRLHHFLLSYGMGMRIMLAPGFMLKIDWATPWDLRSSLPMHLWQGTFSLGYQF